MTDAAADRLPDPGAGFVWERSGPTLVLRPPTAGAVAAFTTRVGGRCPPPWDTLNLSLSALDEAVEGGVEMVWSNRRIAGRAVGVGSEWAMVRQVHGAEVVRVGRRDLVVSEAPFPAARGDAVWTSEPGVPVGVLAADCVPVLLVGRRGVAAVHAGWRGLVAGVVEQAAAAVEASEAFGGPAVGPCCYRVGREVRGAFLDRFGEGALRGEDRVDLWAAAEAAARAAGVGRVASARLCTACHAELFFSHRRDGGRTGRQALVARLP